MQPILKSYPVNENESRKKMRRFNSLWYDRFVWLEYSQEANKAFCFACRNFNTENRGCSEDAFTTKGMQ